MPLTPVTEIRPPVSDEIRQANDRLTLERIAKRFELMHGEFSETMASFDRRIRVLETRAMVTGAAGGALAALLQQLATWGAQ
jgi:hypothetical protein